MRPQKNLPQKGAISPRLLFVGIALVFIPLLVLAQSPQWWTQRGIINSNAANDYAAVNQGQVKNIAAAAVAEMAANLPGGAGDALLTLAANLSGTTATTNDYAAVNIGQLKNISKPFFDRLLSVGYQGHPLESGTYPWLGSSNAANDYAMANIGQVKNLFSFDVTYCSDGSGLPDWWRTIYNIPAGTSGTAVAPRGDGLTYYEAYSQGVNPYDFYNGQTPSLSIVSGNNQTGAPGGYLPAPLVASVTGTSGAMANAPVTFTVTVGDGAVQRSSSATPVTALTVRTDASGIAKVYFQLPNIISHTSQIVCTAGTGSHIARVEFSANSDDGSGSYISPFSPSNLVAVENEDGSVDMTWTNNRDEDDPTEIPIRLEQPDGSWVTVATLPAGTTSYRIPPQ